MPAKIVISSKAKNNVRDIRDWYLEQSFNPADLFIDELISYLKKIAKSPERFPIMYKQTRQLRLSIFPYYILYRYYQNSHKVVIQKVVHAKRNPANKFI